MMGLQKIYADSRNLTLRKYKNSHKNVNRNAEIKLNFDIFNVKKRFLS